MTFRRVLTLLLGPVLALSILVLPELPASAQSNAAPHSLCAISGTVAVDATGQLPFGAATAGTYTFADVAVVCVGGLAGASLNTTSSGSTGPGCALAYPVPGTFGQFCGEYNFPIELPFPGDSCTGDVGGPGLWNAPATTPVVNTPNSINPAFPPISDGTLDPQDWSLTFANVILGHLDCNTPGTIGGFSTGAVALVAVPSSPNTVATAGPVIPIDPVPAFSVGRACPRTGPADIPVIDPDPPNDPDRGPQAWFCTLFVSGVGVIVG